MAISPRNYGSTCTMSMLRAGLYGSNWNDDTSEAIKEGFEESVDYRIVYKNMNYSTTYKTWIYQGNASEKTVGYLHLLSYPYDSIQYKIGDYIQFNYGHTDDTPDKYKFWILQSIDTRLLYNVTGRILPCNQSLKWEDESGNIYSYPCYFNTEMTKTNILDSNQGFNVESGALIAIVQQNQDTQTIRVNQRFVLNNRTYVVYQYNDNIDEGLIYFYLRITAELPEDDKENQLAYNGFDLSNGNILNGDVLSVDNMEYLTLGNTLSFSIYNYVNGYRSDDVFAITLYDVPTTCYNIDVNAGNVFNLTNVQPYYNNPLKIELKNMTTLEITTFNVWLGGVL